MPKTTIVKNTPQKVKSVEPKKVAFESKTKAKNDKPLVSRKKVKNDPTMVSTKKVMTFVQEFLTKNNCIDKIDEWNNSQSSLSGLMQNILKDSKPKMKKLKDPNAPKRPLTAYMFFCEANRKKMQEKYPDKKVTEIAVLLADAWKKVKDKKPYEKSAAEAKASYLEKMRTFVPTQGYEKSFKKVRDPNAPKRPLSGYMIFCMEKRKEGFSDDVKGKDIMAKLGSMWKELPESEKTKYVNKSKEEKDKYNKLKNAKA